MSLKTVLLATQFLTLFVLGQAQTTPLPVALEPGNPVERTIAGGESDFYRVDVSAGQFVRATLDQIGRDMILALETPEGRQIAEADLNGPAQAETLAFVPETNGDVRLVVRAKGAASLKGNYILRLLVRPQASNDDRERIAFEALTRDAVPLARRSISAQQAMEMGEQALAYWRRTGERFWEGRTLHLIAAAARVLNSYEKWKQSAEQGLSIARELNDRALEAKLTYSLAVQISSTGDGEQAIVLYDQVRAAARDAQDRTLEAFALGAKAFDLKILGRTEESLVCMEQTLVINREEKDRALEANTLHNMAGALMVLGRYEEASKNLEQVVPIYREVKDLGAEAGATADIGHLQLHLGFYESAKPYFERALSISREAKHRGREAYSLDRLGAYNRLTAQYEMAIEKYLQSLAISREIQDPYAEAAALSGLGGGYSDVGMYETALEHFEQSLAIVRRIKDRGTETDVLHDIGRVFMGLGRPEKAIEYSSDSLAIARETKNKIREVESLISLANAEIVAQLYDQATEHQQQAIAIARQHKMRGKEAYLLNNMGEIQSLLGNHEAALRYFEHALSVKREIKDQELSTLLNIGDAYSKLGLTAKALEYGEQGLGLARKTKQGEHERGALIILATAERDRGDLLRARSLINDGMQITESIRSQIFSQESRVAYLASLREYDEFYIDLMMRLHKADPRSGGDALAFEASEGTRARGLLELLTEAGKPIRTGVDPKLLERERSVSNQLNARAANRAVMLAGESKTEPLAEMDKKIGALELELEQIHAEIRKTSPEYAELVQPKPLKLKEIQAQLDADTLLLEYALGKERSYLWAVTKDSLKSYELPKEELIRKNALHVYELLTARNTKKAGESAQQRLERIKQADTGLPLAAQELSKMVLSPVADQLADKRLLVVADGALQYVPFAILPDPSADGRDEPLIIAHEVVSLPSASALVIQRNQLSTRQPAPKTLAVIADPVFDKSDVRLKKLGVDATAPEKPTTWRHDTRGLEHIGEPDETKGRLVIRRLPFTRQEADRLMAIAPKTSSFKAIDFQASRENVLKGELAEYRYVHFATHGLLDTQRPGLSSLVLSTVDAEGKQQNGFLRANDIYNMKLPAELVVLSACQTGLGKEVKGEGLIGLTRGFMYAGARRVVVSLWSVNDKATSDLMTKFYGGMLKDNERPAAALRAAQIEMWKQKKWQSPYYWAAFTMQGEWR